MNTAAWGPPSGCANAGLVFGPASPLEALLRIARRVAASEATVLVTGETGTGKEVIARYLHQHSRRAAGPLVPVNCAAIPEALLENELFGHVRGAFTGAIGSRKGRIALAEGGTLFLDEIGELPLSLQVKLLRVLQERRYEPVGSAESVAADFRLIAATNRDLAAEVEAGRFRRDLYFRLMVVPLEVPALRERPQDAVALFRHFWQRRGETRAVAPEVFACLARYPWPGNVRELENLAERLSVCTEGPRIEVSDLPAPYRLAAPGSVRTVEVLPGLGGSAANLDVPPADAPGIELPEGDPAHDELAGPVAPIDDPGPALAGPPVAPPLPADAPADPLGAEPVAGTAPGEANADSPAPPATPPAAHLPVQLPPPGSRVDLPALLRRLEDLYIETALARTNGNRKAAAESLGLQRTTLVEKLRRRLREAPST